VTMGDAGTIWQGATRLEDIPLWDRWDKPALLRRLGEIGSRSFARGFRQEVLDDSARTFPSVLKCACENLNPLEYMGANWPVFTGVDLSSDKRPGNAIVSIAQRRADKMRLPISARFGNWTSPELWRELEEEDRRFHPQIFMVETNAYQKALKEWGMTLNATLPVQGFTTGANKADPDMGLPGLEVEFSNGGWMIPRYEHPLDCDCGWCRLWAELLAHPLAETTDGVMALWFAREAARGVGRQLIPGYLPMLSEEYRA
jgi:hypothetical protein